jgi:ankyrin repeat protein
MYRCKHFNFNLIMTHVLFLLLLLQLDNSLGRRLPTIDVLNQQILDGSKSGNLQIVKESTLYGGNPECISKDPGKSYPLHLASNYGHLNIVKYLVEQGAHLEVKDATGHTPLMYAAFEGHIDVVRYLLKVGSRVDASCMSGETSLHEAAQGGKTEVVKILLENGHEIDPIDTRWNGATPLHWAARWGHTETTRVLLNAGADHEIQTTAGYNFKKWIHYEEMENNPLYNSSGNQARVDIQRMADEL